MLLLCCAMDSLAQQASSSAQETQQEDSLGAYKPAKLYPEMAADLGESRHFGPDSLSNINTQVNYDPQSGKYYFRSAVGDDELGTSFYMDQDEFDDYNSMQSLNAYYLDKNREEKEKKNQLSFTDMKFDIGPADRVFGPGGVQLKLQGSVELDFGINIRKLQDPSLSERSQNPAPTFDFDEKIQLAVDGSVGSRIKFGLNYNTEATFDYDQSLLKLQYVGEEDDILKNIEVGNVSMPLSGSLITGNTSLFGMKADLQFGKLSVSAVISQQESESKTINTSGAQKTEFEVKADDYDENRHFFLTHYFREHYEQWISTLPNISSGISIGEIEVWITNRNTTVSENTTNVVGFADLGEPETIYNRQFSATGNPTMPANRANTLYADVIQSGGGLPDIYSVDTYLAGFNMSSAVDYVKIEGARKLTSSEYTVNKELGYISLKTALNNDEMLAVAFQYTYNGQVYTIGELSSGAEPTRPYALKLLKSSDNAPGIPTWDLMMKNVYSLGAYQVQKDDFVLNVVYRNDSVGTDLRYISEGPIARQPLIKVMNLDRLDSHGQETAAGDGIFDYVVGYTIYPENGKVVFPVLEPFGSFLAQALGNDPRLTEKYTFQALYDSTKTTAQEDAERNKFYITGEYRASSGSQIRLNAMNVPRGSVKVTAGGRELTENVDYTVDYMMGIVTIMNEDIISLGTPVSVTMESQSLFNLKRKSLFGAHLDYAFSEHFNVGATFMYLKEKPLTEQVSYGDDPVSNFTWGLNTSYRNQFQSITDFLNRIPILNLKQPSTIAFNAEFAQMLPGTARGANGRIYIDDFESSKISYDVRYAPNWRLSSTPSRFPESENSNDISYGRNRALLAWYYIDNLFNRRTSSTPTHIRNDREQLSNHFVREIAEQEIFPNRELVYGQSSYIQTLDLAYYPTERGPYNVDVSSYGSDGRLTNPQDKWGGITRRMETTDFETNNIEYLEFWLMDPFVYNNAHRGGDLYINLGEVSEDVLKDGRKAYENGLPADGSESNVAETVWGRVSTKQSISYAFDNDATARQYQDVGLDGLSTEAEFNFATYRDFVDNLTSRLTPAALDSMRNDPFSPLNDPAGDNFHHYRGTDYDNNEVSILERYKRYNGMEGNSPVSTTNESYTTSSTTDPDVEDVNLDNTMGTNEKYFEYQVSLRPEDMVVGSNYIADMVTSSVTLQNGETASIRWYQFKIPLKDKASYTAVGGMSSFKTIKHMRMYLTGFYENVNLRFASLELVRGEWRTYTKSFDALNYNENGSIEMSSVNIEENSNKTPVNYVLPPGVERQIDPSQQQVRQENEQSMSMRVLNLSPKDARALYKNLGGYDMRRYGHMIMYVHAEALTDNDTNLDDDDVALFIRLGSDYQNNYYEYEVPLKVTPAGTYSDNSTADRRTVWPEENMLDFDLSLLTELKKSRNAERMRSGSSVTNTTVYTEVDPAKPNNRISVKGNPSLGEVDVIMLGVRNNSRTIKSAEVWVDDLMLSEFSEDGGVAALANLDVALSDFITFSAAGRVETAGWGSIEQTVTERRQDNYYQYNFNVGIDLGKLFPDKANVLLPVRFSYSNEITSPEYSPFDDDLLLSDVLSLYDNATQRDSVRNLSQTVYTNKSLSIPNVRVGIVSKKGPRPWDPANFTIGGSYAETTSRDPETVHNVDKRYNAYGTYDFSWTPKPWEPFGKIKSLQRSKNWKWIADIGINWAPKRFAYQTDFTRDYYEQVLRDFSGDVATQLDPTFQKDFMWTNKFDIAWDITKNIHLTLSTENNSRITENEGGVDKYLYPDEFEMWKDSVRSSLSHLGNPMTYYQTFTASWNIPFSKIPFLNWITGNLKYTGDYEWVYANSTIASTASSKGMWSADGKINFETLYNKSKYLREVNRKFSGRSSQQQRRRQQQPKTFEETVEFSKGDTVVIAHNLNSADLEVEATKAGKKYRLRYKTVDINRIRFVAREDARVNVNIRTKVDGNNSENPALDVASRVLMLIRNVSFSYSQTDGTVLPGFKPSPNFLGLSGYNDAVAPGWDYVFGVQDAGMLDRAINNGWLVMDNTVYNPAVMSHSETFKATGIIEPWPGFKISVGVDRQFINNRSVQYNTDSRLTSLDGSLSMSYLAIGTSFATMLRGGNYNSELFDNFLAYRGIIQQRLQSTYNPTTGYSLNSDDVLVPAFLAAYSGRDANNVSLDLIPKFWSFLPNWQVTFDGLSRIPWVKEHFRSIVLSHAYNCKYQIGSFSSDQTYSSVYGDEFGYVTDELNDALLPSSRYTMNSVTITEQFSPLIGVDFNLKNSFSFKAEWKKGRTLGLNLSSNQVVESWNNEYVFGIGYKFSDLSFTMKSARRQKKVNNDLSLRLDLSVKDAETIVRKIQLEESQATSGDLVVGLKFAADYVFSERINFRLYYDMQLRNPVVSTSYPTTTHDVGIAVKILLTR